MLNDETGKKKYQLKKQKKKQARPGESSKPRLIHQTSNSLNPRLEINQKV